MKRTWKAPTVFISEEDRSIISPLDKKIREAEKANNGGSSGGDSDDEPGGGEGGGEGGEDSGGTITYGDFNVDFNSDFFVYKNN